VIHDCHVDFTASVSGSLSAELRARLARELVVIFAPPGTCPTADSTGQSAGRPSVANDVAAGPGAATEHPPERILVSRCFTGYSSDFRQKVVLGIEVKYAGSYETHVVKVGQRSKVEPDFEGWRACSHDRQVASRILSPVRLVAGLEGDRAAVLYRDAYTLFGLNSENGRPETLETAAEWAVRDDRPDPLSVERAISQVFTDLGRWFFPGATAGLEATAEFYRARLRMGQSAAPVLSLWKSDFGRRQMRRDAVWLICGSDKPDADLALEPARYLDPVDFVEWMMEPDHQHHLPDSLVGRSHGDLHGRNVLVGVRRGEVEYPAVFDYEEMRPRNVLAWDFAKLETELKVRLLSGILSDGRVRARLLGQRAFLPTPGPSLPSLEAERAQRMFMFLAFEEWLHELTCRLNSREQIETLSRLPKVYRTGIKKLDALTSIVLRIRKEAALWLGFEHNQRCDKWRDELYWALVVYGLLNVRWNYEQPAAEHALIAAGVAAARMPRSAGMLQECLQVYGNQGGVPSYRIPLAVAHRHWKAKDYEAGRAVIEDTVFKVEADSSRVASRVTIREDAAHAIPLIAEGVLLEIECGFASLAEPVLEKLRDTARDFGDFETLGRIGRLFKDAGDRRWEGSNCEFADLAKTTAAQMYAQALMVYEEAFVATKDYYTGINAATLALLNCESAKATAYAEQVGEICRRMTDIARNDRFWVFASEGEACLILSDCSIGERFYRDALAELSPGRGGMANSTYKQLCRLWKALGNKVEETLRLFERSEFRGALTPILGRIMVTDRPD